MQGGKAVGGGIVGLGHQHAADAAVGMHRQVDAAAGVSQQDDLLLDPSFTCQDAGDEGGGGAGDRHRRAGGHLAIPRHQQAAVAIHHQGRAEMPGVAEPPQQGAQFVAGRPAGEGLFQRLDRRIGLGRQFAGEDGGDGVFGSDVDEQDHAGQYGERHSEGRRYQPGDTTGQWRDLARGGHDGDVAVPTGRVNTGDLRRLPSA